MKALLGLIALSLAGSLASPDASAHGGGRARLSVGLHFGAPLYWHPWPAYHYYPAPVYVAPSVVQVAPPVYVERHDPPTTDQQGWWYYCANTRGYYPYVKECPGGWQKVPPAPPQ
jgi:hypothetical protein